MSDQQPVLEICEGDTMVAFFCPGCSMQHAVRVGSSGAKPPAGAAWEWNGDMYRPTFSPSILVRGTVPITDAEHERIMRGEEVTLRDFVCHSFVRDGYIEYQSDCTHLLKGHTIQLQPRA